MYTPPQELRPRPLTVNDQLLSRVQFIMRLHRSMLRANKPRLWDIVKPRLWDIVACIYIEEITPEELADDHYMSDRMDVWMEYHG